MLMISSMVSDFSEKDVLAFSDALKLWCFEHHSKSEDAELECECPFLFVHPDGATRCSLSNDFPKNW